MKTFILALSVLSPTLAFAEEGPTTYNFYFQKAPGPVTVNQGGAPAAAAPAQAVAPAAAAPAQAVAPATVTVTEAPAERGLAKLHLTLGYALTNSFTSISNYEVYSGQKDKYLGGQFALKAEFDLADRISVMGELYKLQKEVAYQTQAISSGGGGMVNYLPSNAPDNYRKTEKNVIDYAVGGAAHIVKMRTTTFSLLGGMMTMPALRYSQVGGTIGDQRMAPIHGVEHAKLFYLGARLRLVADDAWGLDLSYRLPIGVDHGNALLGLTFAI